MDPISVGIAIGTGVVSQMTKRLMEKAGDPEKIARSVNWVFSAASHLFKIRKKEVPADTPISPPPPPAEKSAPPEKITDAVVEQKRAATEEIAQSLKAEPPAPVTKGVRLKSLDQFTSDQIAQEISSLLNQLDTYLRNLRFEEEKAAQFGGITFAPPIVMNTVRIQRQEIARRLLRLNAAVGKAYGVTAPDLEILSEATEA
jgi:hypothetical protein